MEMQTADSATVLQPDAFKVPAPKFAQVPPALNMRIEYGSYLNYCGFVAGEDGPVLVGVFRHRFANAGVQYAPPHLDYLKRISAFVDIKQPVVEGRLPDDADELHTLLAALLTS